MPQTKLSTKIAGGFGAVILIISMLCVWIYSFSLGIQKNTEMALDLSHVHELLANMESESIQVQQWLTDISATRGLNGLDDGLVKAKEHRDLFLKNLGELEKHYTEHNLAVETEKLASLRGIFTQFYETGLTMAQAYIKGGPESGNRMMAAFDQKLEALHAIFDPMAEQATKNHHRQMTYIVTESKRLVRDVVILAVLAILLSTATSATLIRLITKPLRTIITSLRAGSEEVINASGQISSASQTLADGASSQASSLEETSASLEEISSMAKQNSDNAAHTDSLMQEANNGLKNANSAMTGLIRSMQDISKASEETQKIVKTIDEIAFQTNLLALNAAVEAARAGEAGAGFAVVADEVRNLAMRAAEAARNTSQLIEETVLKVNNGGIIVNQTNEAFRSASQTVEQAAGLVSEITQASREQMLGITQVNEAVSQIDLVTQQNAAASEEAASAATELSAQASSMEEIVDQLVEMVEGQMTHRQRQTAFSPPQENLLSSFR